MEFQEKHWKLVDLYTQFEEAARPFTESAVCKKGCADCCTTVGNVDITTLEGAVILAHTQALADSARKQLNKKLTENREAKSRSKFARCAFLSEDNTCSIYSVRPLSCRRLYSLRTCGITGPTVHRQLWEIAGRIETAAQLLDDNGYSGHMSHILHLLKDARFRKTYFADKFAPQDIRLFLVKYRLFINRHAQHP
jgi:uncharacterized protein